MRKVIFIITCFVCLFGLLGTTAVVHAGEEPIKIGLQSAMTGWGAIWGRSLRGTSKMYVDSINATGGLLVAGKFHPIELYIDDHQGDVKIAKAGLERFIYKEKIKFLMIHMDAGPDTWLGLPKEIRANLIHVSPHHRPDVSSKGHNGFGTLTLPPYYSPAYFKGVLKDHPEIKTVLELSPRGRFPELTVNCDKASAEALGIEWLGVEFFDPEMADFMPVLTRALAKKPDMINFGCVTIVGPQLLKIARQLGYKGVIGQSCEDDIRKYLEHAGPEYSEGFYIIGSHGFPESAELKAFKEAYIKQEGEWNAVSLAYYQGIRALLQGIQKAGTIHDIPAIIKGIEQVNVVLDVFPGKPLTFWGGEKTYGQAHQMEVPTVLNTIKNGEPVTAAVVPPEIP